MGLKAEVFFTSFSKCNWFYYATCTIGLKNRLTFLSDRKSKTNRDSLARVFPRFVSTAMSGRRIYFECYLVDSMTAQNEPYLWFGFTKSLKNLSKFNSGF